MPWFPLRGDARITQRCATENCGGQPTWRLEAGGVGSVYCSGCMEKIESDPHWQDMHIGCPACEADADLIDRLRAYNIAIGGGPGVVTNAIDEINRLRQIEDAAQILVAEIRRSGSHECYALVAKLLPDLDRDPYVR